MTNEELNEKIDGHIEDIFDQPDIEPGAKYDEGKPMLSYLPLRQLEHISDVFEAGAHKYEKDNWKLKEIDWDRQLSATLRHLVAAQDDPYAIDEETNLPHIAHAVSQLMMRLYWLDETRITEE